MSPFRLMERKHHLLDFVYFNLFSFPARQILTLCYTPQRLRKGHKKPTSVSYCRGRVYIALQHLYEMPRSVTEHQYLTSWGWKRIVYLLQYDRVSKEVGTLCKMSIAKMWCEKYWIFNWKIAQRQLGKAETEKCYCFCEITCLSSVERKSCEILKENFWWNNELI